MRMGMVAVVAALVMGMAAPAWADSPATPAGGRSGQSVETVLSSAGTRTEVPFAGRGKGGYTQTLVLRGVLDRGDNVQAGTSCWWAKPTWKLYDGFGKLTSRSWYYIEWCGSGGVVTDVLTLTCGGAGSFLWEYRGCSVRRGALGYSSVRVLGDWTYRLGWGGAYKYQYVEVDARDYWNGVYTGTWYGTT